jgi:hypothetical protein
VIEVDVGNKGDTNLFFYLPESFRSLSNGDRYPHNVAARCLQCPDLIYSGIHVTGVGFGHGLDRNGRISPNSDLADLNFAGFSP